MKQLFDKIHPVPDDILEEYLSYWKPVEYARKQLISREGEIEKYLYYVVNGVQKSYFFKDNKEFIIAFTQTGSFSGDPKSLFEQSPSTVTIECITPSKLQRIRYSKHLEMLEKYRELDTLFRKATELLLAGVLDRYNELMAFTIEERFKSFAKRSPQLLNVIPHKDLAAYLRIDATNFSKLLNSVKV